MTETTAKPHVLVDATAVTARGKGMSRYGRRLLEGFASSGTEFRFTIMVDRAESSTLFPSASHMQYVTVNAKPRLAWHFFRLPRLLPQLRFDILHVIGELYPFWVGHPTMLSITEMPQQRNRLQPFRGVRDWISNQVYSTLFASSVRRARWLLSISRATLTDAVAALSLDARRAKVTHLAPDETLFGEWTADDVLRQREKLSAPSGYVLAFATGDGRERTDFLLRAWAKAREHGNVSQALVLAGCTDDAERERLLRVARVEGVEDSITILGYVEDTALPLLYAGADAYVDASQYEGFGLHGLEAMAAGSPVIASANDAAREVLADGATLVALHDLNAFAMAMRGVLVSAEVRREQSERGRVRARSFSWSQTVEATLAAYRASFDELRSATRS